MATPDFRAVIRQHFETSMPISEIARLTNSTENSVKVTAGYMGLKRPRRWSRIEPIVAAGYRDGKPVAQIASEAGTSVGCVYVTASRMGLHRPRMPKPVRVQRQRFAFNVPEHLVDDYRFLTTKKAFRAAEVAQMLGIAGGQG